ncbi:hypothetical protein BC830DRAFT_872157 [Chytriomyces sp. MP71]|nr:hypothetical protein BC830DRAFT_872157 [Chytriomyces sp. MP71]
MICGNVRLCTIAHCVDTYRFANSYWSLERNASQILLKALNNEIRQTLRNHDRRFTKALDSAADYSIYMNKTLYQNAANSHADLRFILPYSPEALMPPFSTPKIILHRCILSARVPYVAFQLVRRWPTSRDVPVKNRRVSPIPLRALIYWAYTGQLPRDFLSSFQEDLYFLAKQWRVVELTRMLRSNTMNPKYRTTTQASTKILQDELLVLVWCLNNDELVEGWLEKEVPHLETFEAFSSGLSEIKESIKADSSEGETLTELQYFAGLLMIRASCPDIIVQIGDVQFPCHKCFLIRSDYFQAFIDGSFTEAHRVRDVQNVPSESLPVLSITLTQDPNLFKCVLEYLYTDNCSRFNSDSEFMMELLSVADLLLLEQLKTACVNHIVGLSYDLIMNPAELLRVSWATNLPRLEQFATRYYATHFDEVVTTKEFKNLVKDSAQSVKNREDQDTIIFVDDLTWWLCRLHGFDQSTENDIGITGKKGEYLVRVGENLENRTLECERKIGLLADVVTELGLDIFVPEEY